MQCRFVSQPKQTVLLPHIVAIRQKKNKAKATAIASNKITNTTFSVWRIIYLNRIRPTASLIKLRSNITIWRASSPTVRCLAFSIALTKAFVTPKALSRYSRVTAVAMPKAIAIAATIGPAATVVIAPAKVCEAPSARCSFCWCRYSCQSW